MALFPKTKASQKIFQVTMTFTLLFFNMLVPSLAQPLYSDFPWPWDTPPVYTGKAWPLPWSPIGLRCKDDGSYSTCGPNPLKDKCYNPKLGLTSDCCYALLTSASNKKCFKRIFFGVLEFGLQVLKYCSINYAPIGSPLFLDI